MPLRRRGAVHYFEEGEPAPEDRSVLHDPGLIDHWRSDVFAMEQFRRLDGWPEGAKLRESIREWAGTDDVLDFGCGYGRLAPYFDAAYYVGLDVNPMAVDEALRRNPQHRFQVMDGELPKRERALASSVLQHVEDEKLVGVLRLIGRAVDSILVVECLGRRWRTKLSPNRELSDYAIDGWQTTVLAQWSAEARPHPEVTAFLLRR